MLLLMTKKEEGSFGLAGAARRPRWPPTSVAYRRQLGHGKRQRRRTHLAGRVYDCRRRSSVFWVARRGAIFVRGGGGDGVGTVSA